ncbi:MAG TPA: LCP family protein [Actinomycetota bacterium]|nr:LCP family protein [Actinomycetota bacterium]
MKQAERPTVEFRSYREKPRRKRKVLKWLLIATLSLAALVGGTAAYLWDYVNDKFRETHQDLKVDPLPAGQAQNILVLGSDRRDVVDKAQQDERAFRGGSGRRADTILVVHVPADHASATILSFPRDLRVRIPGRSGFSKINAAYNGGTVDGKKLNGPDLMMETIRRHTGLKIHHYVEINFASFQKIVDAVGGVRLCVDRPYDDKESGLIVEKAGCQVYGGKLALSYVRMRKQDPRGDFGRIERQQQFMRVLMSKVTSIGVLADPLAIRKLADAVAAGVITDEELDLGEVQGIANKLADYKQSNVDFRVVPSFPDYIGGVSYVIQREAQARALYKALREDTELPPFGKTGASIPKPEDVTIQVLNGTGVAGLAGEVRDELERLGFDVTEIGNADRRDYAETVILYRFGAEAKAALVNELPDFTGPKPKQGSAKQKVDIIIILGADAAPTPSPSPS